MRRLAISTICALVILGCSTTSAVPVEPTPEPVATSTVTVTVDPTPVPLATAGVTTSDAVPSMDELRSMGLTTSQATCFTETIDPEATGRVTSVELFAQAFSECL